MAKQHGLCCLGKKRPGPDTPDPDMKDENQQRYKSKIYTGEGDNTAEHYFFHHADTLQAAVVDELQRLEQRDHTDEKAGIGAGGDKGFVCTEKAEEGPPRLLPSSTWKKRMRTELFCSSGSSFAVALSSLKR